MSSAGEADAPSTELVVVPRHSTSPVVVDVGFELAARVTRVAVATTRTGLRLVRPVARLTLRPPVLSPRLWPQTRLFGMANQGQDVRRSSEQHMSAALSRVIPLIVQSVLDRIDIDTIAASIDLDALVDRLNIDRILDRVDVDAIVATVDLEPVLARVDVDAIAAKIDLDSIVARLDVLGIARDVIDGIDLPEIIRESSGAMASETVVGVRMRGIEADERIARIVDRVMLRRRGRTEVVHREADDPDDSR